MNTNEESAATPQVTDTTDNSKSNEERQNSNSNSNSNSNKKSNGNGQFLGQGSDTNNFEGADPDAGVVLGLRAERIKKKVPFDVFSEKVSDYVVHEYKYSRDIKSVFTKLKLPHDTFKRKHKPKDLLADEEKDNTEVKMQEQRYKMYILQES